MLKNKKPPTIKLLFTAPAAGGLSHQIPMFVLAKRIFNERISVAFLLPKIVHESFKQRGVEVLKLNYMGLMYQNLQACELYDPDIIVEDLNMNTGHVCKLLNIPRISILRTGIFAPRLMNDGQKHSIDHMNTFFDQSILGEKHEKFFKEVLHGDVKIIPGIRSIEVLPEYLKNDPSIFFSGPLNVEDEMTEEFRKSLDDFFRKNKKRKVIYFTFGLVARASEPIFKSIEYLLSKNIAVITNIKLEKLNDKFKNRYYHHYFFPINYICKNVQLVIHHCGSGMYHYPILHKLPTITIGTGYFDREDVAKRLEELKISKHLAGPEENPEFIQSFQKMIESYLKEPNKFISIAQVKKLKKEIEDTMINFDFTEAVELALSKRIEKR